MAVAIIGSIIICITNHIMNIEKQIQIHKKTLLLKIAEGF